MNKEMNKYAYELMVKNNPEEAVKNLLLKDKENQKLQERCRLAIEYIEDIWKDTENKNIYSIIGIGLIRAKLLNILQGEDNE